MEDFFDELKSVAIGIFVKDEKRMGKKVWLGSSTTEFNKLNWDTKKFYVDLAMSQIFLNKISED